MFVAFDMSGAYPWANEREELIHEVNDDPSIDSLFVILFDASVTYVEIIPRTHISRLMSVPLQSSGGTSIRPVQKCVKAHGGSVVRIYSDGHFADHPADDLQISLVRPIGASAS